MELNERLALVAKIKAPGVAKAVLINLAWRADKSTLTAFPGAERIALDIGFGCTAVRKGLRWLRENGHIERFTGSDGRHPNRWRLTCLEPIALRQVDDQNQGAGGCAEPIASRQVDDRNQDAGGCAEPIASRQVGDRNQGAGGCAEPIASRQVGDFARAPVDKGTNLSLRDTQPIASRCRTYREASHNRSGTINRTRTGVENHSDPGSRFIIEGEPISVPPNTPANDNEIMALCHRFSVPTRGKSRDQVTVALRRKLAAVAAGAAALATAGS